MGVVDREARRPVDERTVFRAASLGKPVFAYLVMRLVDEGVLDLDTPVVRYLPKPLSAYPAYAGLRDDARHERLTARLLLSHQSGFPNWRRVRPDGPIGFDANPGERFGYSGEGYRLLQTVLEAATGKALPVLARDKVFAPLRMSDSSYLWEPRFDGRFAVDLDSGLGELIRESRRTANVAGSPLTTAADYARFLAAVLTGEGLSAKSRAAMLAPAVALTSRSLFSAPGTDGGANRAHQLAWTPGWGTFTDAHGRSIFHVGREEGCENYAEARLDRGPAIVILSVSARPDSFSAPLLEAAIGSAYSPLAWLEYGQTVPSEPTARAASLGAGSPGAGSPRVRPVADWAGCQAGRLPVRQGFRGLIKGASAGLERTGLETGSRVLRAPASVPNRSRRAIIDAGEASRHLSVFCVGVRTWPRDRIDARLPARRPACSMPSCLGGT